jgi:hypothetical protein
VLEEAEGGVGAAAGRQRKSIMKMAQEAGSSNDNSPGSRVGEGTGVMVTGIGVMASAHTPSRVLSESGTLVARQVTTQAVGAGSRAMATTLAGVTAEAGMVGVPRLGVAMRSRETEGLGTAPSRPSMTDMTATREARAATTWMVGVGMPATTAGVLTLGIAGSSSVRTSSRSTVAGVAGAVVAAPAGAGGVAGEAEGVTAVATVPLTASMTVAGAGMTGMATAVVRVSGVTQGSLAPTPEMRRPLAMEGPPGAGPVVVVVQGVGGRERVTMMAHRQGTLTVGVLLRARAEGRSTAPPHREIRGAGRQAIRQAAGTKAGMCKGLGGGRVTAGVVLPSSSSNNSPTGSMMSGGRMRGGLCSARTGIPLPTGGRADRSRAHHRSSSGASSQPGRQQHQTGVVAAAG